MNNFICSRCKKRMAVIFMSRIENGETINEGLCLQCAKELGIPQVKDLIDKMGITDDDIESMNDQMLEMMQNGDFGGMNPEGGEEEDGFEMGGAQPFPFYAGLLLEAVTCRKKSQKGEKRKVALTETPEKEKKYKYLENYCENLTRRAREGGIDNIVGREQEDPPGDGRPLQPPHQNRLPASSASPVWAKPLWPKGSPNSWRAAKLPPDWRTKSCTCWDLTALVAGTQFRGQLKAGEKAWWRI